VQTSSGEELYCSALHCTALHCTALHTLYCCLEFNYTIKWVDDGAYGSKNKDTGEWNGLIGELLSQVKFARYICCLLSILTIIKSGMVFCNTKRTTGNWHSIKEQLNRPRNQQF
jgi:hypothetical protein